MSKDVPYSVPSLGLTPPPRGSSWPAGLLSCSVTVSTIMWQDICGRQFGGVSEMDDGVPVSTHILTNYLSRGSYVQRAAAEKE